MGVRAFEPYLGTSHGDYVTTISLSLVLRCFASILLQMAALLENGRRYTRAFAQWLSFALENSGETQARIFHQVNATFHDLVAGEITDELVEPIETTLIRIAVELDLFNILSDGRPKSVDKLASDIGADPDLLGMFVFEEGVWSCKADVGASKDSSRAGSSWGGETDQSETFRSNEDIQNLRGALFECRMQVLVGSRRQGRVWLTQLASMLLESPGSACRNS